MDATEIEDTSGSAATASEIIESAAALEPSSGAPTEEELATEVLTSCALTKLSFTTRPSAGCVDDTGGYEEKRSDASGEETDDVA